MSITWPVMMLILTGALLHVSRNVLIKSSTDKLLDTVLIHVLYCVWAVQPLVLPGPTSVLAPASI
jgi:hypothetical protein